MKKQLVAVFDRKAALYQTPIACRHVAEVLRDWQQVKKNPEMIYSKNPEDFDVYHIGEFDEHTGEVENFKPARLLESGV